MKKIYLLILSLSIALSGWSQVLLTENFNYTGGAGLVGNGGWTAHSGTTNPILVTAAGLTYAGHPGSGIGKAVAMTTSGEDDNTLFATPVTTGSTYMSFLVNVSAAQATGDYFIGLYQSSSIFSIRLYAKSSGAGYVFGVGKAGGAAVYETTVRTFGTTYFIVTNYIFNTGTTTDDVVNLWVNPTLGGTEPVATIANVTGTTADATSHTGVYLRQGTAGNAPTQQVDAILAGITWPDVTPSGAATPTLTATTLAAFGNVCINTTSPANSFTITGTNLSAGTVTVAAVTGYAYSTTSGGTYTPTLTLTPTGGALSQQVFVQFTPTAVQPYPGPIAISGAGVTTPINVTVSGSGVDSKPTTLGGPATVITTSSATVAGSITDNGCSTVTAYGIEYSTTAGFVNGTGTAVPSTNIAGGAYTSALSGLAAGTIYYYHAYATNTAGTGYSPELNFTTTAVSPTLSATALTAFGPVCINTTAGPNSFTITGSSLTAGNITVAALPGFTYSTTAGGTYTSTLTIAETGTVSQQVFVNFTPTAVQSYNGNIAISGGGATAINVAASGSGINTLATVTTAAATAVTSTGATVPGTITANGCSAVTAYGIEYSTTIGFANGSGTAVPSTNQVAGAYTSALSGLAQTTTYYYHAYATNGAGTAYSSELNFTTSTSSSVTSGLVISQIYGAGGNAGATYSADYVEIKNITTSPINLAGLSIQYGAAGVTTAWSGVYALPVASIPAGGYYLIQMSAASTTVGIAIPAPDATAAPAINMSGTAGRVAIVNGTTPLVGCPTVGSYIDFVGFGTTATCFEGTTGPAAAPSATLADFRKQNGCQDTNDNSLDFDALAAAPRNSATTPISCVAGPSLTATTLTAFPPTCLNTTAGPNSFTITGTNLTAGTVTVAAVAGYTYSTTSGGTYTATLPITTTGGALSQQVFVNFTPTAVQAYPGPIAISGAGVTTPINVAVSGSGINTIPTVTTAAATGITTSGATVPGTITANGCSAVTAYGVEYSTTAGFVNGTGTAVPSTNQVAGAYTSALSGLAAGTIYYYHAYATNGGGTGYSSELNFTTTALTPTLTATALTAFGNVCLNTTAGPNSFTLTGSALTTGNITVAALPGFTYSTTSGGTYTATLILPETGTLSQQVFVNFTPTAVQSYSGNIAISGGGATAINVAASGAGINTLATVTAGAATAITSSGATVPGTITANGCSAVTAYGVEYSTTPGFANGSGTAVPSTNQVAGAFTSALSGLAAATTYYYHAYATNGGGTAYSAQGTFITTGAAALSATALTAFGPVCLNTTAGPNSFTLTGSGLTTGNITVAALAGYTYSTTSGGTYTATLIIPETGTVSQQVFVKFTPTAVQSYNGNIAISGGGATAINVAASGSGVNTIATVTTAAASAITTSSATVPGTITANGCSAVTVYGVEYSTTPGFANGTGTAVPSTNQVAGGYTSALSGLASATNYYYHAYATNSGGTAYSSELTFTTGTSSTVSSGLVISQLYGSGGNAGATYSADYVEIKNITTSAISTSGLSIQYGSAAVTTAWSGVYALPTASIPAGGYYLIQMSAASTTVGIAIPTPDATANPTINMSGTAGRVALVNGTTALVGCPASGTYIDLVGYGTTATCFEGSTGPAAAPGAALADFRKLNGCQDTNDNSVDFDALLPAPRNSATAAVSCGSSTTPSLSASALTAFGPVCLNTTAGPNSFTITGTNLTAGTVTVAGLLGYTYSTTSGGTYTATLAITNGAGAFTQQVFVQFTPTAVQSYNGNIAISGGGVTTPINVTASGSGVNTIATVVSGAASAITANSATVAGSIPANGCSAITAYGVEYSTTNGFANGTGTAVPSTNIAAGAFTSALSGLASSTVYYYHAYATNSGGTAYGAQGTFTTTVPTTPTLSSTAPAAFGNTCVNTTAGPNNFTISGTLLTNATITVGPLAGFTFSTTSGGTYTPTLTLTQGGGTYSQQIFVKFTPTAIQSYSGNIPVSGGGATAINVSASGAGVNSAPTVTSGVASAITSTTATVAGSIPSIGCSAVTAYGIEYSTVSGFANGTGTAVPSTNLAAGAFSSNLTGLTVGTTYYYHAYATNGGGTGYGNQLSFTTTAAVITASALTAFGPVCTNTTAGPNSFTLTSGAVSAANINVAALAGYTYSTTATGTYTPTLSITHAAGALAQTVFVKFTPTAVQSYNGNIVISGGGATANINVAASGSGINTGATVVTGAATNVLQHSATLAGTISSAGCNAPTSYGIEYSSIIGFANGTGIKIPSTNISTTTGGYTVDLNGLVQNTTYYYKAYAISASGTAYGAQQSFTTATLIPGLVIYSNPIYRGGQLNFSVDNAPPAHYVVHILNNLGQVVFTQGLILQLNFIDTHITVPSFLPAGTYTFRLTNTNGTYSAGVQFMLL